jgi:hypothetical protein
MPPTMLKKITAHFTGSFRCSKGHHSRIVAEGDEMSPCGCAGAVWLFFPDQNTQVREAFVKVYLNSRETIEIEPAFKLGVGVKMNLIGGASKHWGAYTITRVHSRMGIVGVCPVLDIDFVGGFNPALPAYLVSIVAQAP